MVVILVRIALPVAGVVPKPGEGKESIRLGLGRFSRYRKSGCTDLRQRWQRLSEI